MKLDFKQTVNVEMYEEETSIGDDSDSDIKEGKSCSSESSDEK